MNDHAKPAAEFSLAPFDYPDWVPASLVKELRQGLRGRQLVVPFLLAHVLALVGLFLEIGVGGDGRGLFLFPTLLVLFLFVIPLSSFGALKDEIDGRNFELVLLTRLALFPQLVGKWLSLAVISLLLALSLFPYLLVFYTFAGVEIPSLLAGAILVFLASVSGTAIVLGTSAGRHPVVAFLLIGVLGWPLLVTVGALASTVLRLGLWAVPASLSVGLPFALIYCCTGLEFGRSALGKGSTAVSRGENRTVPLFVLCLLGSLLVSVVSAIGGIIGALICVVLLAVLAFASVRSSR